MSAHDNAVRALCAMSRICRDDHARCARLGREGISSGADIDFSLALSAAYFDACEAFRRRYYPRAGKVAADVSGSRDGVWVASPQGRRVRRVEVAS